MSVQARLNHHDKSCRGNLMPVAERHEARVLHVTDLGGAEEVG